MIRVENAWYIYRKASHSAQARNIEKYLLDWGCDGTTGGALLYAVFIYAYHKAPGTRR